MGMFEGLEGERIPWITVCYDFKGSADWLSFVEQVGLETVRKCQEQKTGSALTPFSSPVGGSAAFRW